MEYIIREGTPVPDEITDLQDSESSDRFQKFVHELFEKNGILNDLRAYLRGHIVDVLKSAETGDLISCQKRFTQRLELKFQAMNILITEYLLRLEFSYTVSVFTSEIPLANMVFQYSQALLKTTDNALEGLRFGENDVWSILHYLGIQCDSDHACQIVESYKSESDLPLLCCILKCIPIYRKEPDYDEVNSSEDSLSSIKSGEFRKEKITKSSCKDVTYKCKHYAFCPSCQNRMSRLKEKYKRKKIKLEKNPKRSSNELNIDTFMRNVGTLEQSLIDEMFQQLKTVYEAEVDMIKEDEEKKIKRSLASHAIQLQRHRGELEESFKAREVELEHSVQNRKQFLWGLARALREQKRRLAQAQNCLARSERRLADEEKSLKLQMQDAEETLKKRGEEMRNQISEELVILQNHLETMKHERDNINKERIELENLKRMCEERKEKHNDSIKSEIIILRKYIESCYSKCVAEKGTVTDDWVMMNNENVGSLKSDDDRLKVNQVINDLKKSKNVNYNQLNLEDVEQNRQNSLLTNMEASEINKMKYIEIQKLKEENDRLKEYARQQSEHIDRLSNEKRRLQSEARDPRPRTAPSVMCSQNLSLHRTCDRSGELGVQSQDLCPGDAIPFIGVIGDRQSDDRRRRLLSQLGKSRRQWNPDKTNTQINENTTTQDLNMSNNQQTDGPRQPIIRETLQDSKVKKASSIDTKTRENSPKSVLRKAREKLKNKSSKDNPPLHRDKSPNETLREAKLRLRKLEIEAEAVEKSYLDFRRRQSELRGEKTNLLENNTKIEDLDKIDKKQFKPKDFNKKIDPNYKIIETEFIEPSEIIKKDFDKYLREYQMLSDCQTNYRNNNSIIESVKPIPEIYSKIENDNSKHNINYLEKTLIDFRKLYQTPKSKINKAKEPKTGNNKNLNNESNTGEHKNQSLNVKNAELNIEEFNEVFNMPEQNLSENEHLSKLNSERRKEIIAEKVENNIILLETKNPKHNKEEIQELNIPKLDIEEKVHESISEIDELKSKTEEDKDKKDDNKNMLIVEVEKASATTIITTESNNELLFVVESSVDNKALAPREIDVEETKNISTQMTIIVSPKNDVQNEIYNTSKVYKLTENDTLNTLYNSLGNKRSSVVEQLELTNDKDDLNSEIEKELQEYPDDFSADVDNYNSQSDYGKNSPISLPKTSEDEKDFWDS